MIQSTSPRQECLQSHLRRTSPDAPPGSHCLQTKTVSGGLQMSRPPTRNPLITPRISLSLSHHVHLSQKAASKGGTGWLSTWTGSGPNTNHGYWRYFWSTTLHGTPKSDQNKSRLDNVSLSQTKKTHASPSQTTSGNGRSGVGWRAHTAER